MGKKVRLSDFLMLADKSQPIVIRRYVGEDEGLALLYSGPAGGVIQTWEADESFNVSSKGDTLYIDL